MKRNLFILFGFLLFFSLAAGQGFSQEFDSAGRKWILGDVDAIDLESSQLTLSYIDYNSGQGEQILIDVDADTNYSNVDSFKNIKIGDVAAVDYMINAQGEAVALDISIERLKQAEEKNNR